MTEANKRTSSKLEEITLSRLEEQFKVYKLITTTPLDKFVIRKDQIPNISLTVMEKEEFRELIEIGKMESFIDMYIDAVQLSTLSDPGGWLEAEHVYSALNKSIPKTLKDILEALCIKTIGFCPEKEEERCLLLDHVSVDEQSNIEAFLFKEIDKRIKGIEKIGRRPRKTPGEKIFKNLVSDGGSDKEPFDGSGEYRLTECKTIISLYTGKRGYAKERDLGCLLSECNFVKVKDDTLPEYKGTLSIKKEKYYCSLSSDKSFWESTNSGGEEAFYTLRIEKKVKGQARFVAQFEEGHNIKYRHDDYCKGVLRKIYEKLYKKYPPKED